MGCAQSIDNERRQQQLIHRKIEDELKKARNEQSRTSKLLLLGAEESGKSTLMKQMRLLYANPYSQVEREAYREVVFANALQSMQAVLTGFVATSVSLPAHLDGVASSIMQYLPEDIAHERTGDLNQEVKAAISQMWENQSTKDVVALGSKFQLNDSAQYFFEAIDRIGAQNYMPTDQDILRTRVRSTGIVEEVFDVKGQKLRVFDVGGQRSERKKWIHCFDSVDILIFVVAISEFDQTLYEDESVNRLAEATMLFESLAGSRWFERSSFVLLLNKIDIFEEKIRHSDLHQYFPDYLGAGTDVTAASAFLKSKFVALNPKKDRPFYVHLTCATDTRQVRVVIAALMDTVLNRLLSEVGLM
ncbi:guanine nucleotide-binding protein subunit alpha [Sporobolomyces koalae]|uniref:guanine nucleotide-binding protein subunit alpha n=1 Tax=Sporobolomyces koalae TaxID=500713 RepID=UPI0031774761